MVYELISASALIAACTIAIAGLIRRAGVLPSLAAMFILFSLGLYNRTLYRSSDEQHNGIAGAGPELTAYGIAILLGITWIIFRYRTSPITFGYVPLVFYLLYGAVFIWESSPLLMAGTGALILAIMGYSLGFRLAERSRLDIDLTLASVAFAILVVQLAAALLQLMGLPLVQVSETSAPYLDGRLNGLTPHPNTLGKLVVLMLPLLLLAIPSEKRAFRKMGLTGIAIGFVLLALSQGRANFLAAVLLIVIWIILTAIARHRARNASLIGLVVAALLSGSSFMIDRFTADPGGGSREHLLDVAARHIADHPLWGSGPNTYVSEAGKYDAYTAGGMPVHNSFLLIQAEIGIVGSVLLWGPLILALASALRSIKDKQTFRYAIGQVSLICAMIVIGMTGWGLVAAWVFPLWLFISGHFAGSMRANRLDHHRPSWPAASPNALPSYARKTIT